jgi:hypothetical protein
MPEQETEDPETAEATDMVDDEAEAKPVAKSKTKAKPKATAKAKPKPSDPLDVPLFDSAG